MASDPSLAEAAREYFAERQHRPQPRRALEATPSTQSDPPPYDAPPDGPSDEAELIHIAEPESPKPINLDVICAADLASEPIQPRRWLVPELIPTGDITLLSGDGGTGKSLLALQLGVAIVTAGEWIGTMPEPGRVLFITAEDDREEIHRRLATIHPSVRDLKDLSIVSLAGKDAILATPGARGGPLQPTPIHQALERAIQMHRPDALVLDTLADLFGGDEIKRNDARQFIGMLRRFCVEYGVTIVLLAHPSLSGMNKGTGTSGSTGWSNSVRSRLYLERKTDKEGEEADPDLRILSTKKANYGPAGKAIAVRWRAGKFVLDGAGIDIATSERQAERMFLKMLAQFEREGRPVSPFTGRGYAPNAFNQHPDGKGVSKRQYQTAMDRMLSDGRVKIVETGPPSKRSKKLAEGLA